jgi:hypothetical protein
MWPVRSVMPLSRIMAVPTASHPGCLRHLPVSTVRPDLAAPDISPDERNARQERSA